MATKRLVSTLMSCALAACTTTSTIKVGGAEDTPAQKQAKAAEINVQLGLGYFKQGDVQRAQKKLMLASEQAPNSPDVAGALGYYFERTGNLEQAELYYAKAMNLTHGAGAQLNNYGAFLCRQGKYKVADDYFEKASRDLQYVNSAGALENAGLCALAIPNLAQAERYFERAYTQDPRRTKALYELAKLAFNKKQYDKVLQRVEQYNTVNPLSAAILLLGYQAATKLGAKDKAENYAWFLKNRFSDSFEYKQWLASGENDNKQSNIS